MGMTDKKILLYGTGQHADLVQYSFEWDLKREVAGFVIDCTIDVQKKNSLPIYDLGSIENQLDVSDYEMFVAIGGVALNSVREFYLSKILRKGFNVINCISPNIRLFPKISVGINSYISEASWVMPFTNLGSNVVCISSNIGHHCTVEDNVSIVNSAIGANSSIKRNCEIGINVTIAPGLTIGEYSIIDSGCIIKKNVLPYSVVTAHEPVYRKIDSRRVSFLGKSFYEFQRMIQEMKNAD